VEGVEAAGVVLFRSKCEQNKQLRSDPRHGTTGRRPRGTWGPAAASMHVCAVIPSSEPKHRSVHKSRRQRQVQRCSNCAGAMASCCTWCRPRCEPAAGLDLREPSVPVALRRLALFVLFPGWLHVLCRRPPYVWARRKFT
jgi:hypothetical protein